MARQTLDEWMYNMYSEAYNCVGVKGKIFKYDYNKILDWEWVSRHLVLTEDFIRKFNHRVHWKNISLYQKLSENFIREFQDQVYWDYIPSHQTLSEDFIREFQNQVDWTWISCRKLSEDFIREFQHRVIWTYISIYQTLSEDFIEEFKATIQWIHIKKLDHLSDNFIVKNQELLNLSENLEKFSIRCIGRLKTNKLHPKKLVERLSKHHNHVKSVEDWVVLWATMTH